MMKHQFVTMIATMLMVGATTLGVTLAIMDGRFEQVDARLDRLEDRMDRMEASMNARFREMATAIGRLEGLIQGLHGPARAPADHDAKKNDQPADAGADHGPT